ncbi:addiction module antidote protein, HigA family [Candidatus Kaiserbacteria bacterium RIFCSPHIGHO2_02_FULL_49_34]|uniref:Addiction module antidote protein, HigA family n=1 Tax=Candidatus Kaiserbacteria bacterium RIFCSPHIGHO2_02_FULL_49_34 TaxID=1798491 RepID=A0A1F6DIQ1_9BACT|nr:MAG: addiction module antidote protein, HigA family [Candidatus Kaiserbacteria bacterium RIFCSPHIGHO2_02_FULL_49_34]
MRPIAIHPGEILKEEFMVPLSITAYALAKHTGMQQTAIGEIIKGKRGITADTAIRLGLFFDMSAEFWMNVQARYNLDELADAYAKNKKPVVTPYARIAPAAA